MWNDKALLIAEVEDKTFWVKGMMFWKESSSEMLSQMKFPVSARPAALGSFQSHPQEQWGTPYQSCYGISRLKSDQRTNRLELLRSYHDDECLIRFNGLAPPRWTSCSSAPAAPQQSPTITALLLPKPQLCTQPPRHWGSCCQPWLQ